MTESRLRRAGQEDAAGIAELWLETRRATPGIPPPAHGDEQVHAWFGQVVRSHEVWVAADEDDRPSGVMVLHGEWVEQLYVLPGRQRRGCGSALLALAQATRGSLSLWTFVANTRARSFYEARGFRPCGEPSADNEEGAPAVRYRWSRPARPDGESG